MSGYLRASPLTLEQTGMSNRATRKLERQAAEQQLSRATDQDEAEHESEDEAESKSQIVNAFDMLDVEDVEHDEDGVDEFDQSNAPKTSRRKKKKRTKAKAASSPPPGEEQVDEIDLALQALAVQRQDGGNGQGQIDAANAQLYRLLAVESKHLNALTEMKRLFGSAVADVEPDEAATPRRRGRGPVQLDLGGALGARYSPVSRGQGLKGLALKRNPFILGKEDWPQATSGGLGMEVVERMDDGTIEFRFVHGTAYQRVQGEFETCVESMDPQRMISMLQFNRKFTTRVRLNADYRPTIYQHYCKCRRLPSNKAIIPFRETYWNAPCSPLADQCILPSLARWPKVRPDWISGGQKIGSFGLLLGATSAI